MIPGDASLEVLARARQGMPQTEMRVLLGPGAWRNVADALAACPGLFAGSWGEADAVHALLTPPEQPPLIVSTPVTEGGFRSLAASCPAAAIYERMLCDLWGHRPEVSGGSEGRVPWLDHGSWGVTRPLAPAPGPAVYPPEPPEFRESPVVAARQGHALLRGPVRRFAAEDPGEPYLLRLGLDGDIVLAAEARLGLNHRGLIGLIRGRTPEAGCRLVARAQAEHGVAASLAFCRAVEHARGLTVPGTTEAARDVLLALETLAVQLLRLRQLAAAAHCERLSLHLAGLREAVVSACGEGFGHRLLMETVSPGGAASPERPEAFGEVLDDIAAAWPRLVAAIERSLMPRLDGVATISPALAAAFGRGDLAGDAARRSRRRLDVAEMALRRLRGDGVEPGRGMSGQDTAREGLGGAASADGPVWCWVRLGEGGVAGFMLIDPAVALWSLFERLAPELRETRLDLARLSLGLCVAGADL